MSELPEGWAEATLGDLGLWNSGGTPSKSNPGYWNGPIPWVSPKDLKVPFINDAIDHVSRTGVEAASLKIVPAGTLLFVVRGLILARSFPVALTRVPVTVNQDIRALTPYPGVDAEYLLRILQTETSKILLSVKEATHGTLRLDSADLRAWPIPIASFPEQRRIVKKVEDLLARVNVAQQCFARAESTVKRLRQALIDAACRGDLTEEWRRNRRIDVGSWRSRSFAQVICGLRNGVSPRPQLNPPGVPILRISAVRPGVVDVSDVRFLPDGDRWLPTFALADGDLLFTRYNGSLDLLGVCGVVSHLERKTIYPDKLIRVRLTAEAIPEYICAHFSSSHARDELLSNAKSSAGQNGISGADLKKQQVVLPSLAEQAEIVSRLKFSFRTLERLKNRLHLSRISGESVATSILAKAFSGELVPTEAELARREGRSYEPATALLERIRAERERAHAKPQGRVRSAGSDASRVARSVDADAKELTSRTSESARALRDSGRNPQ